MSDFCITPYSNQFKKEWDRFVDDSKMAHSFSKGTIWNIIPPDLLTIH